MQNYKVKTKKKKPYHINNFIVGLFCKHKIQNANKNSMELIFTLWTNKWHRQ